MPPFITRCLPMTLAVVGCLCPLVTVGVVVILNNLPESQYEKADKNLKEQIRIHYKLADLFNCVNEPEDFKRINIEVGQLVGRLKILAEEFTTFSDDVRAAASAANGDELERAKRADIDAKRRARGCGGFRHPRSQK